MSEEITVRRLSDRRNGETDWARVRAMTEDELERAIAADPDSAPEVDWSSARIVTSEPEQSVDLRVDPDVLAWFREQGQDYLARMNAALRAYMNAHPNE